MAAEPAGSKQQGSWLPSSPTSLNAATGWAAAAPSAPPKDEHPGAELAREQEPQTRYLTTSGLFENSLRPPAWKEATLESAPPRAPEPSELVNGFRSALLQPQNKVEIQLRKNRKGILALALAGILLAATTAVLYLYRPNKSAADLQTAKTWMAKQWTLGLQELSNAFQSQAAAPKAVKSTRRPALSAFSRERQSANLGVPAAPTTVWITPRNESIASFDLYITDPYGRRWVLTPAGEEFGPVNRLGDPPAPKPRLRPIAPKDCRSPFYYPACP